jgi:hypothetical protein
MRIQSEVFRLLVVPATDFSSYLLLITAIRQEIYIDGVTGMETFFILFENQFIYPNPKGSKLIFFA